MVGCHDRPMLRRLLIANRAEIAVRIIRTAADRGIETVAVAPADDTTRHWDLADDRRSLPGSGVAAYLDVEAVVAAAVDAGCDALHPGYGLLSERAELAEACADAGVVFVGPRAETLRLLGDKTEALARAAAVGVPTAQSTPPLDDEAILAFVAEHGPTMVKAAAGGGGRGMRLVNSGDDVASAVARCRSEAVSAFGDDTLFAERFVPSARHLEVQVVGDGDRVTSLGERDCTVQRQQQKIMEFAPAPFVSDDVRGVLAHHAVALTEAVGLHGVATVEFLLGSDGHPVFIEVNPRLQVEHTVTEAITGLDLVGIQLDLAAGQTLDDLGLDVGRRPTGAAVQLRINAEWFGPDGVALPSSGVIGDLVLPAGPGVRVDTHARPGTEISPSFDSLVAKVVVDVDGDHEALLARARRALREVVVDGVDTNVELFARLLERPELATYTIDTGWLERIADKVAVDRPTVVAASSHGSVVAPLLGTVVSIGASPGQAVAAGDELVVLEAMKMEHVVTAPSAGSITSVDIEVGDTVTAGATLVSLAPSDGRDVGDGDGGVAAVDLDVIRPDLAEAVERHRHGDDERRPDRVAKRHGTGRRTARENLADLVDPGTFVEYGPLVVAAQRRRRPIEELITQTPADGLVAGIGDVNGAQFPEAAQCVVASYDYMVLAGTQGHQNHRKKDRLFEIAAHRRLPVVLFAEGGGGRPGDTDGVAVAGLDCMAFRLFGELSGTVPLVGINGGYCFAGNAALLGCCDVVIATESSNVGMGGPAMIEGGGLGVFHPSEIGPIDVQRANGVVDIVVADEAEAVATAKRYLSYFQGSTAGWEAEDQRILRHLIPENRVRIYDVRAVIDAMCDTGSVLELRAEFGVGMITALARIEGRAVGVLANNPQHLAGAIDADGADKASRFMQLCQAFGLPILSLCDTPGIMVGPDAEATGLVRHASRMFVTSASLTVPMCTIVLRKGYGLGAQAMAAGSFKSPVFTVGWPTSEFGGMGLEGFVRLGYRNELAAIDDPAERQQAYEEMVARMYEVGKGVSMADHFEIDDVIDPADSRRWITTAFRSTPPAGWRNAPGRPFVDTW